MNGISNPGQDGAEPPRRSRGAMLLVGFSVVSLLVSMLLAAAAVFLVVTDSLPDVDDATTVTAVIVLLFMAMFTAALGWLGLRLGRERLANPRHSRYPGF